MLFFSESIEDRLDKICGSNTDLRELLQMKLMKIKQSNWLVTVILYLCS